MVDSTRTSTPAVPFTRGEAVLRRIRDDIVSGELPPGTPVKDAQLAARLGVSITPVREALAQLAAEGLIDVSPNRVRRVTRVTTRAVLELVDVAAVLARAGVERGLEHLSADRARELRAELEAADRHYRAGDLRAAVTSCGVVANTFILAGGNRELQTHMDLLNSRAARALLPLVDDTIWTIYLDGYRSMLDSLERDDHAAVLHHHGRMQRAYRARILELLDELEPGSATDD